MQQTLASRGRIECRAPLVAPNAAASTNLVCAVVHKQRPRLKIPIRILLDQISEFPQCLHMQKLTLAWFCTA